MPSGHRVRPVPRRNLHLCRAVYPRALRCFNSRFASAHRSASIDDGSSHDGLADQEAYKVGGSDGSCSLFKVDYLMNVCQGLGHWPSRDRANIRINDEIIVERSGAFIAKGSLLVLALGSRFVSPFLHGSTRFWCSNDSAPMVAIQLRSVHSGAKKDYQS